MTKHNTSKQTNNHIQRHIALLLKPTEFVYVNSSPHSLHTVHIGIYIYLHAYYIVTTYIHVFTQIDAGLYAFIAIQ